MSRDPKMADFPLLVCYVQQAFGAAGKDSDHLGNIQCSQQQCPECVYIADIAHF